MESYWLNNLKRLKELLKDRLPLDRFEHSLFVSKTAADLARQHNCDVSRAELAGLLHDYARNLEEADLLALAESNELIKHPLERQVPMLLHGPVGALLVKEDLGISDREVLEAIAYHTTAAPGMSVLAGIVYLADMIEPLRDFPGVDALRNLAKDDLEAAVLAGLNASIKYCIKRGVMIHPCSIEARNFLLGRK